jgi:hypothetical protein
MITPHTNFFLVKAFTKTLKSKITAANKGQTSSMKQIIIKMALMDFRKNISSP